jgi:hypothetical protein
MIDREKFLKNIEAVAEEVFNDRFIVYFDFLGFSEIIRRNYLLEVEKAFVTAVKGISETLKSSKKIVCESKIIEPIEGWFWFSDTLILYSGDSSPENLLPITSAATYLLASLLNDGFPTRCVITLGQFKRLNEADHNLFLGKGLVQAFELEKKMNWCGGILDPYQSGIYEITKAWGAESPVLEYEAPQKEGDVRKYKCLNWPKNYIENFKKEVRHLREDMLKIQNNPSPPWPVENKIRNTEQFFNFSIRKNKNRYRVHLQDLEK